MTDCMNGLLKKRRSIYNLGNKEVISDEAVAALVKEAVKTVLRLLIRNRPEYWFCLGKIIIVFGLSYMKF